MSVLSVLTGYKEFNVIDDATHGQIEGVMWVDDEELEYERILMPPHYGTNGLLATSVVKVSRVSVNWAAREIHVNEPRCVQIRLVQLRPRRADLTAQPCDECCDGEACRRCNQCLRYRCEFGEVSKP